MPNVSSVFILKTFNAANALVTGLTRGYKFTGGAVVTVNAQNIVTVDVSGASANAWDIFGNAGASLVLGTTTADDWEFVSGGLSRGGFQFGGDFFLKTNPGYSQSRFQVRTDGVATADATLTSLFVIPITNLTSNIVSVRVVNRRDTGSDRAAFERKIIVYREGAGAVLSPKVHTPLTDKTNSGYNILFNVSGNNLLIQVQGVVGHNLYWTGVVEYQGVSTNA